MTQDNAIIQAPRSSDFREISAWRWSVANRANVQKRFQVRCVNQGQELFRFRVRENEAFHIHLKASFIVIQGTDEGDGGVQLFNILAIWAPDKITVGRNVTVAFPLRIPDPQDPDGVDHRFQVHMYGSSASAKDNTTAATVDAVNPNDVVVFVSCPVSTTLDWVVQMSIMAI